MANEETKEVANVASTAIQASQSSNIDIFDDAGAGQETMTSDDLIIPRIGIVQSLSPQRIKGKPEFIEGAEEGMFFENVSRRIFKGEQGILVVPIQYDRIYLEWYDRKLGKGSGLYKNHGKDSSIFDATKPEEKTGRRWTNKEEGRFIAPTAQYFVYIIDKETGAYTPALMGMSSVFLKHAKRWNSNIKLLRIKDPKRGVQIEPPIFYNTWHITTVPEQNQQGSWYRHEISSYQPLIKWDEKVSAWVDDFPDGVAIYKAALKFRQEVIAGKVKVSEPEDETHSAVASESDEDPM